KRSSSAVEKHLPRTRRAAQRIALGMVPDHGNGLACKQLARTFSIWLPPTERIPQVSQPADRHTKIGSDGVTVGFGACATGGEAVAGGHASLQGIFDHSFSRFTHQITEGRQRDQLPVREQVREPRQPIVRSPQVPRIKAQLLIWHILWS